MLLPLRYTSSVEVPEKDEQKTQNELIETLLSISETSLNDESEALRAVHAKSHGLLKATFSVSENLPEMLAQGLFARPGQYDAVIRLSSAPGDLLPDTVSTHHGFGLKVKGVIGEHIPYAEPDTQDFLFANGKSFNAATAADFLKNLKILAATTDKAEGLKVAFSTALRTVETTLESVGGESALLTALGGHPASHILSEEFFTQVPIRYGDYIAKLGLFPTTLEQKSLVGSEIDLAAEFDAHRQAVRRYLQNTPAAWELRVQLCADLERWKSRTWHGRRTTVRISLSRGSKLRPRRVIVTPWPSPWTKAHPLAPGMGWWRIGRWVPSIDCVELFTKALLAFAYRRMGALITKRPNNAISLHVVRRNNR
jgi:hypothetical protein